MSAVLNAREPSAKYLVASRPSLIRDFELFATAPAAFTKLRELILVLAVRGKIVKQRSEDEPASSLIAKIEKEKIRLISEKRLRNRSALPTISEAEQSFSLPVGWIWSRLGNLGDWGAGATPSRSRGDYYNGDIPWFKSGELTGDSIGQSEETVTLLALKECSLRLNQVGDVLVAMYGATIGKTAILAKVGTTNQAVCACTPFSGLEKRYLLLLLKALRPYFVSIGTGGAQPNISREKLIATVVGLPPLAEQHRIVARVEELMKLCDALEARGRLADEQHARLTSTLFDALATSESAHALTENWQRIAEHFDLLLDRPEAIDALEQTILHLALRGLLLSQDAADEPANVLLARLRSKGDAKSRARQSRDIDGGDSGPFELPSGWAWASFPELGIFGRGKSKHRPRNDPVLFSPGVYPLVQTGEVARAKGVIKEFHSLYSEKGLAQSKLWPKGTMCITIAANIADVATLGFDACFPDSVVGFVPDDEFGDATYFLMFVETAKARLMEFAPATAQKNINLEVLEALRIPLPPLAEMKRIVTRVKELRHLCAQLRERLTSARRTQSKLAEALVAEVA